MNLTKQSSLLVTALVAVVSLVLFSGQLTRPYGQPQPQQRQPAQTQQRQPVQTQQRQPVQAQRQVTPPKPITASAKPPTPTTPPPAAEMPSLYWLPADIKFPEMPQGASSTTTLFGDPKAAGMYVTRTLIPKGAQTIPHVHPDSRIVTVLSGICHYGRGEEFDEKETIPMPPGSFFTEPAGVPHFIWAKDGDVVLQTTAIGPSGTQMIPAKQPSAAQ